MSAIAAARHSVELNVRDARTAAALGGAYAAASPLLPAFAHVTCPLRALTGIPCPLCGMTTAVGSMLRLDPTAALHANPVGIGMTVVMLLLLVRPPRRLAVPAWAAAALALASWAFELGRFGVLT